MKYRKKPVVVDATQWFENGDHPKDNTPYKDREGAVVRYYRIPALDGTKHCKHCAHTMHVHGWIDTLEGGHIVCPGDWIITGVQGEHYPCKPDIFEQTYEAVEASELDISKPVRAKDVEPLEPKTRKADR